MWATADHADANRLTVDLLVHRFTAPNGLDLGLGVLGPAALPLVALLRWRQRAMPTELDPRIVMVRLRGPGTDLDRLYRLHDGPAARADGAADAVRVHPVSLCPLGIAGFLAATSGDADGRWARPERTDGRGAARRRGARRGRPARGDIGGVT